MRNLKNFLCLVRSAFTTKHPPKLCGWKEKCFVNGEKEWGHYGGVLCKHSTELAHPIKGSSLGSFCGKTFEKVDSYCLEVERKDILMRKWYDMRKKVRFQAKDGIVLAIPKDKNKQQPPKA